MTQNNLIFFFFNNNWYYKIKLKEYIADINIFWTFYQFYCENTELRNKI